MDSGIRLSFSYRNINFAKNINVKNHALGDISLCLFEVNLISVYVINPRAIPFAIEKVSGIIIIIISEGSISVESDQSNLSTSLNIIIATYISTPAVAYGGTISESGDKNIDNKNANPVTTAVKPVLPPISIPAELST
jgi:hypothetical protein